MAVERSFLLVVEYICVILTSIELLMFVSSIIYIRC